MTKNIFILLLLAAFQYSNAQDRSRAETAVMNFMKKKTDSYRPGTFGEFFVQTYPEQVEKKLNTSQKVKYSLVHSFQTDAGTGSNTYFHLTEKYQVIGSLTEQQMHQVTMEIAGPKADSIMSILSDSLFNSIQE